MNQMMVETQAQAARTTETIALKIVERMEGGHGDKDKRSPSHYLRYFDKMERYGGKVEKWKEWSYQFAVTLRAAEREAGEMLEAVQSLDMQIVSTSNLVTVLADAEEKVMKDTAARVFSALCLLTTDEANSIVRGVDDMNGYVAWKRLYDRYNPRTPASLTQAWLDVVNPKRARDMREAGRALDLWELKVAALKKEHGEEPTTGLKAALLLKMLPENVHFNIVQGMDTKKLNYEEMKSKVKLMADVYVEKVTPKPMDIDEMRRETWEWQSDEEYHEDVDVMAVGETCHRCGGIGHYARECATVKGKGKEHAKGKAAGKGWSDKGKGKGVAFDYGGKGGGKGKGCFNCGGNHFARECPKGAGKGAKGKGVTCFNCGGRGHRAAQCPSSVAAIEHDEGDEEVSVDGVWEVSEVTFESPWTPVKESRRKKGSGAQRSSRLASGGSMASKVSASNRFATLAEDQEEDSELYIDRVVIADTPGSRYEKQRDVKWIQEVCAEDTVKWVGTTEIVVDSAADESVCPWEWAKAFQIKDIPEGRRMRLKNASGGKIQHYGEKVIHFKTGGDDTVKGMKFQVCDVQRPLAAVWRMVEKGNEVHFGPKAEDNFIFNPDTQEKVMMRRKGRSFVLDAEMVKIDGQVNPFVGQA